MRFKDLFPGVAFATLARAAAAAGFSAKTIRNKYYQGDNPLGIVQVDGRLVVPAENFDAWLTSAYRQGGLAHLAEDNAGGEAPQTHAQKRKRGPGRPRKIAMEGGGK